MSVATADFYNKSGVRVGSINCLALRTWVLNAYGECSLIVPYSSIYATQDVLEFGNYVIVTSDTDTIPPWSGIIEPPRRWGVSGITIKCYSSEYILKHRVGPKKLIVKGTASSIVSQILQYCNDQGDTRIRTGVLASSLTDRQETINPTELYDDIERVISRDGLDWCVIPKIDSAGILWFELNTYTRLGDDVTGFSLEEGKNLEFTEEPMLEEGLLFNDLLGYGEGSSWETRPTSRQTDQASINRYGLRQHAKEFSGNKVQATLDANTTNFLNKYKQPRITYQVNVLDGQYLKPTFANIRLGNTIPIRVSSYGFATLGSTKQYGSSGTIKVYGMGYNEDVGKMQLVVTKDSEDDSNV